MKSTLKMTLIRWAFNSYPCYRGSGGMITYIAEDWRDLKIKIPLNRKTRNYVSTIYGGSMYAAVDPIYMLMLIKNLGSNYRVWDKSAAIRFLKPGRSTLYAYFHLDQSELDTIIQEVEDKISTERQYKIELVDQSGIVHAAIDQTIYIGKK